VFYTRGIEQRQFDRPTNSSTKDFMEMIANHFDVNLLTSTRKDSKLLSTSTYYFSVESKEKLHKVIDYFDTYSLMGTKSFDYEDFKTVYFMILSPLALCARGARRREEHLADLGRNKIKLISSGMNTGRVFI
jgi:LAGLIDADG endonuclease